MPAVRRRALLCAMLAALAGWAGAASADPAAAAATPTTGADPASGGYAEFDRSMLSGAGQNTTDLSRFEHGNPVMPGNYYVDVYLNNSWVARRDVRFAARTPEASATACVDEKLLSQLDVHPAKRDEVQTQLADPAGCVDIGSLIPDATMTFDMSELRLDVSVPQAYMSQAARGYVDPQYWDAGVLSGMMNYNFTAYRSTNGGLSQTNAYLGLNTGVNLGAWQLRQNSTVTWQSSNAAQPSRTHWQNIATYVQRALPGLRAELTVGDSFTDGQVFDSYAVRGVQLSTDDRMLPDSLRGYAPVVRGVAETNALVTIRQNGMQIYQTTVSPGPFSINDLYPTGYGGSLDVTVTEADGRIRTFSVPYASVAQLLRPGTTRFSIVAGELRDASLVHKPDVVQATLQHGINNTLTGYAGIVASQGYAAALIGGAVNTRFGAIAADLTDAHTEIPGEASRTGQSLRVSYSKLLPETQTSFTVAAYRYSTSGYLSLTDAAQARDFARRGLDIFDTTIPVQQQLIDGVPVSSALTAAQATALAAPGALSNSSLIGTTLERQRNRFDLTMNQALGTRGGTIYVTGSAYDYWGHNGTDTQFQLGYNNHIGRVSFGISATRTRDVTGRYDNTYYVNMMVPLGTSSHSPTLLFNMNHDPVNGNQEQATVNGTLGADNQFNYGVSASHNSDASSAGAVNVGYRSPFAILNASYGSGSGYSQASVGASGSIVLHPGGITFGQSAGDTVGIVYAPGATGASVTNSAGVKIDGSGYALVPYLSPYMLNTVQIDPKGLPLDVQMESTSAQVAPYAGAVVMLKFKTVTGRSVIVQARLPNGDAIPFGAEVFNANGMTLGVVGQAGKILARGVDREGQMIARWTNSDGETHSCSIAYQLPPTGKGKNKQAYEHVEATCTPTANPTIAERTAP
nr:fimbrial biogenesis outer membrane usher protein [Dyella sp. RRB7]